MTLFSNVRLTGCATTGDVVKFEDGACIFRSVFTDEDGWHAQCGFDPFDSRKTRMIVQPVDHRGANNLRTMSSHPVRLRMLCVLVVLFVSSIPSMLLLPQNAAEASIPTLVSMPADASGLPGQASISVPINVSEATGIAGVDITLTFNPSILTASDVQTTSFTSGFALVKNLSSGQVIISMARATGITSGSGALVNVVLSVSSAVFPGATSPLTLQSVSLFDENALPIPYVRQNGLFTVPIPNPVLSVLPNGGLSSTCNEGGPFTPLSKQYSVSNTGGGTLNWTASADQDWVTVSPANGTNSGTAAVSINGNANSLTGSPSGTVYTAIVTFGGNGGSTTRQVTLTVYKQGNPVLSVSPLDGLVASGNEGGPFSESKQYSVSNSGEGTLNWTASADQDWVTVSPANGTNSGTAAVSINSNANSLIGSPSGTVYTATVTFGGNGGSTTRQVTLTVYKQGNPVLSVSPLDGLVASGNEGGLFSESKQYSVSNSGEGTLSWTASVDQNWVTVAPANGTNSGTAAVSINSNANSLTGSPSGTVYTATVTFGGNGGSTTRQVSLTVYKVSPLGIALYVASGDNPNPYINEMLTNQGFDIDQKAEIPSDLAKYRLIILSKCEASNQTAADYIKNFVQNGGGAIIISGTPKSLAGDTDDLSSISDWFGAKRYGNAGGYARVTPDRPLGADLWNWDSVDYCSENTPWAAAIYDPSPNANIIAEWDPTRVYSFTYRYGLGKVFYIAGETSPSNAQIFEHWELLFEAALIWVTEPNYCIWGFIGEQKGGLLDGIEVCFRDKSGSEIMPCVNTDEDGYYIQYGFEPYDKRVKNTIYIIPNDLLFRFSPRKKSVKIISNDTRIDFKGTHLER